MKDWKGRGLKAVLFRLCFSATVYDLWQERNNIRHGNRFANRGETISENQLGSSNEDLV